MSKKKYYYKNNHKSKEKKVTQKKLTYDDIVNVRKDVSEIEIKSTNINNIRFVALSIVILAIVFCSLILFRII